jgi:hypothetical protein
VLRIEHDTESAIELVAEGFVGQADRVAVARDVELGADVQALLDAVFDDFGGSGQVH